jgi:hypothetical protein
MYIYTSEQVRPYVYMGIHKVTGEIYIGYREANSTPSHLDIFEYRTSSKIVKPKFDDYTWYIVAEFITGDAAYDFEQQLIFENWDSPLLLNRSCQFGHQKRFKCSNKGRKQSDSHIAKLTEIRKNRTLPADFGAKVSAGLKGKPKSEEHKIKTGNAFRGIPRTEETKQKIKEKRALQVITHESRIKAAATRARNLALKSQPKEMGP